MTRTLILLAIASLFSMSSCGKKDKRADGKLTGTETPTQPALPVHEDSGATLKRKTGTLEPTRRPTVRAAVDRIQHGKGFVLAAVSLPVEGLPTTLDRASYLVEAPGTYGSAFGWTGMDLQNPQQSHVGVVVRFRGDAVPATFRLRWREVGEKNWREHRAAGTIATIDVSTPANVPVVQDLDAAFWDGASRWFSAYPGRMASQSGFIGYARNRTRFLSKGIDAQKPGPEGWNRGSDVHAMMELYSGMTSVNEALQSDRGLRIRGEAADARNVNLGTVEGLTLADHPWDRMLGELDLPTKAEPLADYVAADMAYLHFGDLRTFVKLIADLDDWVSPVAQWMEERGGASHFMSRYEEQLVVERSGLAEKLGHVAASGVVVAVSDPYLREGTDVSMIFRVANRSALVAALGAFEASSRTRHPQMKSQTTKIDGVDVQRLFTPDGRVDQYRAEYGDVLVISNSPGAIEHLIAAHQGKVPRISEQGDFKYMRALYPWSDKPEEGFIFLSDAFVARAVSPEVKILEARRMDAQADLFALNYAALLRGWVDGVRTATAADLVKAGYVAEGELHHVDGTPISFTSKGGARSDWGTAARLVPIRDLKIEKVTEREADAYNAFRQTYQSYWRAYLDPIAAKIERSDDGKRLRIDARMLPLINASDYDDLIREVGLQKIIATPTGSHGLEWTLAIGENARVRHELDGLARGFIPGHDIGIGWLGKWVSFGVADRSGLWDMALRIGLIPTLDPRDEDMWAGLDQLSRFPIYGAAHVANKMGLAALLTGLKTYVSDAAPGMVAWGQSEPYRDIPIVTVGEGEQSNGQLGGVHVHYATVGDVFVVAFDRATLLTQIDRQLAGPTARVPTGPPSGEAATDAQAIMDVDLAEDGWLARTILAVAEMALISDHELVIQSYETLWRGFGQQALTADQVRELGVAYTGIEPRSPHGGAFEIRDGFPTHTIYGDGVRPVLPAVPVPDSPITRVLTNLSRLSMSLEFDGEGDHRGLHSTVGWDWR